MKAAPLEIRSIAACRADGVHRVTALVAGEPVWFESREVPLRACAEAFASAFLLPALEAGCPLRLDGRLDPTWTRNVAQALAIFGRWWRIPRWLPDASSGESTSAPATTAVAAGQGGGGDRASEHSPFRPSAGSGRAPGTALFFSGGVDSFYSLLRGRPAADLLVTIHGFDYGHEDRARVEAVERCTREVAAERGLVAAFVATNVRGHPLLRRAPWEHVHGGVLAAIGHLLGDRADRVLISSSVSLAHDRDWGSHPTTDPLWSSSRVSFLSVGDDLRRSDKLRRLVGEPLLHRHLRVCWQNDTPTGNCSLCQKCVFTRTVLADCGALERFTVFEPPDTLLARLRSLPPLRMRTAPFELLMRSPRLDPEIRGAIGDLLRRTRRSRSWPVRCRRAVADHLLAWGLLARR